jgi:magnesium-protoporphyrin IX monomethyl ester (oxidative) cyclase
MSVTMNDPASLADRGAAPNDATLRAKADGTLRPRFYTTDFAAIDRFDVGSIRAEWEALMDEFEADRNRHHFHRSEDWPFDVKSLSPELREDVLDFMVTSLTSEFSGCVLYAEMKKRCANPDMKRLFGYLSRDEARHAGFINQCLRDFGTQVDMSFLVKQKKYTYFSPKFILYATYLSEKIGYARYIRIYRELEAHPEHRFHPIFRYFKEWCLDEFRHGEALALMLRATPPLLEGSNRWWIRFFQLAVYATMFVRDHTRPAFYGALGVDIEAYDMEVFRITRDISSQVFPDLVDVDHPQFLSGMRRMRALSERIGAAKRRGGFGWLVAFTLQIAVAFTFLRLFLLPPEKRPLPQALRVEPTW